MSRSYRWQVQVGCEVLGDKPVRVGPIRISDITDFWPTCGKTPIDEVEFLYRVERAEWAAQFDESDPYSQLGGRIGPMTCALP
jgi:hypothetical protein